MIDNSTLGNLLSELADRFERNAERNARHLAGLPTNSIAKELIELQVKELRRLAQDVHQGKV